MKYAKLFIMFIAVVGVNYDDILSVVFYDSNCNIVAQYKAESVYIKANGEVEVNFSEAPTLRANLQYKDLAYEMQISAHKYFRSYTYEGKVIEHLDPVCKGSV